MTAGVEMAGWGDGGASARGDRLGMGLTWWESANGRAGMRGEEMREGGDGVVTGAGSGVRA